MKLIAQMAERQSSIGAVKQYLQGDAMFLHSLKDY